MKKKVVIVGGGIIGLSSAYYLQKEGHQVTVIDQSDLSDGASFINAGYLTPSHFIPLAAPGMISQGIKYMFDSSSPFYMRPRLDKDFLKWVLLFNRSCSKSKVDKAIHPILNINLFSQKLFNELHASGDFDFHLENKGLLMAFQDVQTEKHEAVIAEQAMNLGLKVDALDKEQLSKLEPNLVAKGAFHYHSDAHTTPQDFMSAMINYLKNNAVQFKLKEEVLDINHQKEKIEIKTTAGVYVFDELVLATGAWSESIAKKLKNYLPVQPGKGYSIDCDRSSGINYPTILCDAKVAVTPMDGLTRFAGTMEFAGLDNKINKKRVLTIANTAKRYYKNFAFSEKEIAAASFGFRPVSPDGLPYIGKLNHHENITIATGHAMMGWSLGPASGKLVSEIVSKKTVSIDVNPFSPNRKL